MNDTTNMDERVARAIGIKTEKPKGFEMDFWVYEGNYNTNPPPFSTSVDTAIKYIVPAMRERGWSYFILDQMYDAQGKKAFRFGWDKPDSLTFYAEIKDDSPEALALAMCESALQILEKEDEDDTDP